MAIAFLKLLLPILGGLCAAYLCGYEQAWKNGQKERNKWYRFGWNDCDDYWNTYIKMQHPEDFQAVEDFSEE